MSQQDPPADPPPPFSPQPPFLRTTSLAPPTPDSPPPPLTPDGPPPPLTPLSPSSSLPPAYFPLPASDPSSPAPPSLLTAHLSLLSHFAALRTRALSPAAARGALAPLAPRARWAALTRLSAFQLEAWLSRVCARDGSSGPGSAWERGVAALPIEAALVWWAWMATGRMYEEDVRRVWGRELRRRDGRGGWVLRDFPVQDLVDRLEGRLSLLVAQRGRQLWEDKTGDAAWDLLEMLQDGEACMWVECPWCGEGCETPLLTPAQTGFCDPSFLFPCPSASCGRPMTRETLGISRLLEDCAEDGTLSLSTSLLSPPTTPTSLSRTLVSAALTSQDLQRALRPLAGPKGELTDRVGTLVQVEKELERGSGLPSAVIRHALSAYTTPHPFALDLALHVQRLAGGLLDALSAPGVRWLAPGFAHGEGGREALEKARGRYDLVLALAGKVVRDGPVVVPLDVDFVWITHLLQASRYRSDVVAAAGCLLDRTPAVEESLANAQFDRLAKLFEGTLHLPLSFTHAPPLSRNPLKRLHARTRSAVDDYLPATALLGFSHPKTYTPFKRAETDDAAERRRREEAARRRAAPPPRSLWRYALRVPPVLKPPASPSRTASFCPSHEPSMATSLAQAILDFTQPLDVTLLDQVAQAMLVGVGPQQQQASTVLAQFQEHPEAWQRVPAILETSANAQTKYIALQIMDRLIKTRWKVLPEDQRSGIRNFVVQVIVKTSSDDQTLRREKSFVNKLNLILVQILKQEWPHNWPTFIPEIVTSSQANLSICENNMVILKLLSEEIFEFSAEQMTTAKTKALKAQICQEFAEVFSLCVEVLEKADKASLIKVTLEAMLRFLNWIPLGYIFETPVIDHLITRFLEVPEFRNVTLKCLSEIGGLQIGPEYNNKFIILFNMVMTSVNKMIPPHTDIAGAYEASSDADQELVLNLALFLTNFLSAHVTILETATHRDVLLNAHLYLIKISQVEEREVFKICLEYWAKLVADLYDELVKFPGDTLAANPLLSLGGMAGFGGAAGGAGGQPGRRGIYTEVLSNLRLVMVERMAKPEEVLIVENDEGEIVREFLKDTDTVVLYKSMREVLVYLTHLDVVDTEMIMTEKLSKQVDGSEWSWANLNTLCWAIGSISGAMNEETEKRFLVTVIKDLLGLTEMKRGKDNKAVVASNIMYIVGQYPRFLKAHWKFLKTVVNKLFEFAHETHEGVQDMACDTFIKIAQKCRRHFVMQQSGESEPFIDEILRNLQRITADLSPLQIHTFYEAVGYMISAQPNKPQQELLIANLMTAPNAAWDNLMQQAAERGTEILSDPENIKILSNILKTNTAACSSIGTFFLPQLARIYMDLLGLYTAVSGIISATTAEQGLIATKTPKVRGLRTIKKEILKLVGETYIRKAEDLDQVNRDLLPPLLEAILGDYKQNIPAARDAEVLSTMVTIVSRLGPLMTDKIPAVLDAVFECTLAMINQDLTEFPEHRVAFFKLLRQINANCFDALLAIPAPQFKLVMDAVVWATKHTMRDIGDLGLTICVELIDNVVAAGPATSNGFFQAYYLALLQDMFFVLTDADHKSGFKSTALVLARLFKLVEQGDIQVPLDPAAQNNPVFVAEYTANLLKSAFPHLQPAQITAFVSALREQYGDFNKFRITLRDFLIALREFQGEEATEVFQEEREEEAQRKRDEEQARAAAVPGLLKPSEAMAGDDEEL
ncbi:Karyopherin transporter [Rhodotorula kratochvilovae]